ncbi:4-(cytidine 5'-diphospho)-2-C-methyl-D-erythritol kinase [Aquabacterium sp. CECT 9606]|uniref:4-(cytidine 5'-diphospho)-2-C-methyl-D-erythritol kinase n=1 Tax=Aquabacterium sp. CECT 9606 TaxID=2845822 RepID=UPI001E3FAF6F|nr:4-(cytidine 5'-diphospho)-2-C-methyl-D-erythritol kinase [Aquabacterium sp. CECT 9606]CAH0349520.1 4-diphosphocytidyl-2-C-methyl-D-erythritol kinase [Aquabacterium sp. CECT 9606]
MASLHNLPAPAKLNLFLHVTGRRDDGYHLLQSVFVLIDWADTLHIDTRDDGQLHRHDLGPALPADDLCLRAAKLLQQESATSQGADIQIDKQVPWGAGMGGGSSDAATVLLALNQLWGLHWSRDRLAELALRLGADVPFFIHGHNAWVEGIGEQIMPIALPPELMATRLAVLKPPVAVPTQAIFTSPHLSRNTEAATISLFLAAPKCFGRNDLQAPAEHHSSQISQALEIMRKRFGNSRMTGSGSAVFSWLGAPAANQSFTPADVSLNDPTWAGRLCRVLGRHPLFDVLT